MLTSLWMTKVSSTNLYQNLGVWGSTWSFLFQVLHIYISEASGENCQDQPHSAFYSNAHDNPNDGPKHTKIRQPVRAEREMWKEVDKDLNKLLEGTVKGSLKTKLVIFSNIIYNYGEEKFGLENKRGRNQVKCQILSRWQQEIKDLRKGLRNLSKQWKIAKKSNDWTRIVGLDDLRFEHRERVKVLRKAERLRRKRKQLVRERSNFYEDPFKFMKSLFSQAKSGALNVARQELEEHLRRTYSNSDRNRDLLVGVMLAFWEAMLSLSRGLHAACLPGKKLSCYLPGNCFLPGNGLPCRECC